MLFEFIPEALHPFISLCHCMSKIPTPKAAIALDEETRGIAGGNLDYGLRTRVKREHQGSARQTMKKKLCFQVIDGVDTDGTLTRAEIFCADRESGKSGTKRKAPAA